MIQNNYGKSKHNSNEDALRKKDKTQIITKFNILYSFTLFLFLVEM